MRGADSTKVRFAKLTSNQEKILSALDLQGTLPLRELKKTTGLKEHTIRYCLKGLEEKKMLSVIPFLNVNCLGFSHYGIFFSLGTVKRTTHSALLDYLLKSENVSFLCELGGDYQYEITVCARDIGEVEKFLAELVAKFGSIFAGKSIGSRIRLIHFRFKYLFEIKGPERTLTWGVCEKREKIDDLDHQILSVMSNERIISATDLSRKLGIPYSTAEYRIRGLEEKGIIAGYVMLLDTERLGYQSFLVTVVSKGFGSVLEKKFRTYCLKNPYIRFLVENFGEWDYELGIETDNPQNVTATMQELAEIFGAEIHGMKVLPVFRYLKVSNYPFRTSRAF